MDENQVRRKINVDGIRRRNSGKKQKRLCCRFGTVTKNQQSQSNYGCKDMPVDRNENFLHQTLTSMTGETFQRVLRVMKKMSLVMRDFIDYLQKIRTETVIWSRF